MHPAWLRRSSVKYSRYFPSSAPCHPGASALLRQPTLRVPWTPAVLASGFGPSLRHRTYGSEYYAHQPCILRFGYWPAHQSSRLVGPRGFSRRLKTQINKKPAAKPPM